MKRFLASLEPREVGLIAAALALVADQGSKLFMLYGAGFVHMAPGEAIGVLPFFNLVMVWNPGISYGLFPASGGLGTAALVTTSTLAVAALSWLLWRSHSRALTMMHVAMFEAVNAIDRRYTPYKLALSAERSTSREAAAAVAAHDVLLSIYPDIKPDLDTALTSSLAPIAEGESRTAGIALGKDAAAQIIQLRAKDGSNAVETYRPLTTAGVYVPTAVPLFQTTGATTPWVMTSGSQFRPGPPPALDSEVWTKDINEIREVGGRGSPTRTPEQTTIGRFWFFVGARTYNPIVRQAAMAKSMDLVDCARLFALTSMIDMVSSPLFGTTAYLPS